MLIERKQEVLKTLDTNYLMIRDSDWELLCLAGRDNEWYYIYSWEEYRLTKSEMEALLDKASWIAITPVIDEKVLEQYKEELKKNEEKMASQIEDDYFEEE